MFEYFNPNPTCKFFKSGKPKSWYINDSSVRTVAKALNVSWEVAYKLLSTTGSDIYDVMTSKNTLDKVLENNGYKFVTLGKPTKGSSRPTVKEFLETHQTGTYVLNLADYFVTVIDNVVYDVTENCFKSSVYSYWEKVSE
jgi:hypothetical protein